ncbi:SDR family oxidoreductase [Agrococcus sp. 1P02AA]|uniref:SDR family oxidoreductase n=1 Tax=Agrococcus sp. 1P02AA TaxID=3132259 RepID=UPI0039A414DC
MTRTAIITGAASGIGQATKALLDGRGYRTVGVDLQGTDVDGDLSNPEGRQAAAAAALEAAGGSVDVVVACAGISAPIAKTVSVNYFGVTEFLEALRPALARSAAPRVGITSSFSSLQPTSPALVDALLAGDEATAVEIGGQAAAQGEQAGFVNYSGSKRAISRWVRRVAPTPEWAGAGIAVNAVGPGIVESPMTAELLRDSLEMLDAQLPMPLNYHAKPETIAGLLAWLVSEENTHVTGQTVYIDGGAEALLRGDDIFSALPDVGGQAPGDAPA